MAGALFRSVRLGLQRLRPPLRLPVRWSSDMFEYDYMKTEMKVEMLSQEEDTIMYVQSYSQLGFRLNSGVRVIGPCAVFPRSILHWNVKSVADIDEASLSLFTLLEPKLDLLIIGKGDRHVSVDPKIIMYLRSKKINVEVLPTDQALATFNFLNAEKRYVAGAFLPPNYVQNERDEDAGMAEQAEDGRMFEARLDYGETDQSKHEHFPDPYEQFEKGKKVIAKKILKKYADDKDSHDKS